MFKLRACLIVLLALLLLCFSGPALDACGDKLLVLGRGVRFQRDLAEYLWYSTGLGCRPRLAAGGTEISRSGAGRKVPRVYHCQVAARDGSRILPSFGPARKHRQAFHGYAQQARSGRVQRLGTTGLSVATRTVLMQFTQPASGSAALQFYTLLFQTHCDDHRLEEDHGRRSL